MQEIRRFSDSTIIEQGRGKFDDYCVFLTRPNECTHAPTDTEYFSFFIEKAERYTSEKYIKIMLKFMIELLLRSKKRCLKKLPE